MNSVILPDDADVTPDPILLKFAARGNRVAVLEEVYRRANGEKTALHIAKDHDLCPDEEADAVADAAWAEYQDPADGVPVSERCFILDLSYGHVADHVFSFLPESDQN